MNPLLLAAILLPGAPINSVPNLDIQGASVVIDDSVGRGPGMVVGDLAVLTMDVNVAGGKDLFDTELRGLPYTVKLGDTASDACLCGWAAGMKVGGCRTIYTDFVEDHNSLVPYGTPMVIHMRLVNPGS